MLQLPTTSKFHSFSLVFKVQAILRKVHQMTPKWPWTSNGQKYPILGTTFYWYPRDKCIEWPQNDIEHEDVKGTPHKMSPKFAIRFPLRLAVFESQAILTQVQRMTQNDLKQ